jgi:hypothetical protein
MAKRRLKVFISYARSDQAKAHDLYKRLISDGLDAWIDKENLLPGQDWELEIRKFIRKADVIIVCLSKNFNKAGFRQKEVRLALDVALEKPDGEIFIIPARLEECDTLESLRKWNWVDLFGEDGYGNLIRALRQRASEIGAALPALPAQENLQTVQIILDGAFSEFTESKRDDLVGVLAALLHVEENSIRVLRTYPGSIVIEIELTKIGANRLLNYFEKGDFRLKRLGIISVKLLLKQTKKKRIPKPKENSDDTQPSNIKKIVKGNRIIVEGDVIGSSLIIGHENKIETLRDGVKNSEIKVENQTRSKRLVSDRVLKNWLALHKLIENPFGNFDLKNYPHYPRGAAQPSRWDVFLDPISSFGFCKTFEDAQALSHLLRKECLSLDKEKESISKRLIFPLRISAQQASQQQSPLLALAYSAAQTWLDFLPKHPKKFLEMPQTRQNFLLELLYWSFGSSHSIISLLQSNGLSEKDANSLSLVIKIEKYAKEITASSVPQDSILLSWLKLRPSSYNYTYLIFPLDTFPVAVRSSWLERLNILIPELSVQEDGVIAKVISSIDFSNELLLPLTPLDWSESQLQLSLDSQFDHATEPSPDPKAPKEGKVRFIELFGSGAFGYVETEERTTNRLISTSHNSLARMLALGNRLLQYHCEHRTKDGVPEKYLYVEDLEYILTTV